MPAEDLGGLVLQTMMGLTLIIVAAKLGGELMTRLGQPPVLGELLMGILLGNLGLIGIHGLEPLKHSSMLEVLAQIGAILLLFEVGIESDLGELLKVGWSSLLVAALGVIVPMILGYAVAAWLIPDAGWLGYLFVGGTLTATSVGITARVLKDLGKSNTKEAHIILGAAIVDDVIGLVVMAVISGLAGAASTTSETAFDWIGTLWIIAKACLFLVLAVVVGRFWSQRMFQYAARLKAGGALIGAAIAFCFLVSTVAGLAGLAPIVGAFAAGIVLDEVHYQPFLDRGEQGVDVLLAPITTLIVPVFFVAMGLRVDILGFAAPGVAGFAAAVTVAALIGKQICGLGVLERGVQRMAIGVGMIPRGEVGLIFAGLGSTLVVNGNPVLSPAIFSGLVMMVMLTTFVTPPLLKLAFERNRG